MIGLSFVKPRTDIQKERKQRIKEENKSVHIGYLDNITTFLTLQRFGPSPSQTFG